MKDIDNLTVLNSKTWVQVHKYKWKYLNTPNVRLQCKQIIKNTDEFTKVYYCQYKYCIYLLKHKDKFQEHVRMHWSAVITKRLPPTPDNVPVAVGEFLKVCHVYGLSLYVVLLIQALTAGDHLLDGCWDDEVYIIVVLAASWNPLLWWDHLGLSNSRN